MLLSLDVLAAGLWRGVRLKVGMDTLAALSCAFTLADTLLLAGSQDRGGQLSYCPAALFGLFFLLHGTYHKRCALRLSCRTAAAAAEPYLVTLDEGKWNGKDTYAKWSGTPAGFGSQIQMDDGAQRIYRVFCPVLLLACIVFSLLASFGIGEGEHLMWCLSATFTAAAGFGGALAYGRFLPQGGPPGLPERAVPWPAGPARPGPGGATGSSSPIWTCSPPALWSSTASRSLGTSPWNGWWATPPP